MTDTDTKRSTTSSLGVHLHDGEITGEVDHQQHEHSGGLYPVVTMAFGGFAFTIFPGRNRAIEMADVLTRMAADLRNGADRFSVQALED